MTPSEMILLRRGLVEMSKDVMLSTEVSSNTSTLCQCGSLLAYVGGLWHHIDACPHCYARGENCEGNHYGPDVRRPWTLREARCAQPAPMVCAHATCRQVVELDIPCAQTWAGRECCGCCWNFNDDLESRKMWPR
jgi:hypothetical protein